MPKRPWITKDAGKNLPSLLWTIKPERTLTGFLPQNHLLHLCVIGPKLVLERSWPSIVCN